MFTFGLHIELCGASFKNLPAWFIMKTPQNEKSIQREEFFLHKKSPTSI